MMVGKWGFPSWNFDHPQYIKNRLRTFGKKKKTSFINHRPVFLMAKSG